MAAAAYLFPVETISGEEREKLIIEHLPQVRLVARRIHERLPESVSFDDLFSAGVLGLIGAIDNFDPSQNVKLRTYAEFRIRGAILDSLRETDWAPRLTRRLSRDLQSALSRAEQRLGRVPEEAEIANELGVTVEDYRHQLTEVAGIDIGEIEYLRDDRDGPAVLRYQACSEESSPEEKLEKAELERLLGTALDRIPRVERTVLSLYFFEELTLREISEVLDVHFTRVSQIKSQAILRLRSSIAKRWPGARA